MLSCQYSTAKNDELMVCKRLRLKLPQRFLIFPNTHHNNPGHTTFQVSFSSIFWKDIQIVSLASSANLKICRMLDHRSSTIQKLNKRDRITKRA